MEEQPENPAQDQENHQPEEKKIDETRVVARIGFMSLNVRPGKLMPQQIQDAFQRSEDIVNEWNAKSSDTFEWSFGDFTGGELQFDEVIANKLGNIPVGEKLLKFTMFPSAGTALCIRNNGELVEFDVTFTRK